MLESLLADAFKGKGFQKISELLQEREIEPPQKYSESLFTQLDKALRKVLTDSFNFYLVSWFERARAFVNLIDPNENKFLMLLLEDFFDSALVALSEALCRLTTKKWRDDLVHHWFEDKYLAEAFKEIKDREFETVKKPSDEKLEEFWIDFNADSQSVTFYVDSNEGALWDSVRLSKDAVSSYSLKEEDGENIVKIYMKIPAILNKTEATKIKISFSAKFEILSVLRKVLGDEKMMPCRADDALEMLRAVVEVQPGEQKCSPAPLFVESEKALEEDPMEELTPKQALG
ncbi:synaptonemal complex protein 2-like [Limosa lapponica baueri]|uniref:Synaptonemal complex protein 2-like n=1 Tax=Limosa lapponica baueri TaxID=1758121 RepID=A0A2I0TLE7_LIMLA|nr:synaptonemal complex protein 2-like [Limosa lapponica baueri]